MQLFIQCPTGISGDMFLSAMADLGLDISPLGNIFREVGLEVDVYTQRNYKHGLVGSRLVLESYTEQSLRYLRDLRKIIQNCPVSNQVVQKTDWALQKLADTEAKVHGADPEDIHFHEIGAVDTLVDILGAFWALEKMRIREVNCSSLPWFQGHVETEHGTLPLPAPATLELLQGKPVYRTDFESELVTPTGALLVDSIVDNFSQGPCGILQRTGMGWGTKDLGTVPNALRMFVYSPEEQSLEQIWVLETNLDHLTGEEIGSLFEKLFEDGALDVFYLPGIMKKNRSGGILQVLCSSRDLACVQDSLFKQTLSLGVRRMQMERVVMQRREVEYPTPWGSITGKQVQAKDKEIKKPEFDSLKELADSWGLSAVELRYLIQEYKMNSK